MQPLELCPTKHHEKIHFDVVFCHDGTFKSSSLLSLANNGFSSEIIAKDRPGPVLYILVPVILSVLYEYEDVSPSGQ